jgi:hypothetical protein
MRSEPLDGTEVEDNEFLDVHRSRLVDLDDDLLWEHAQG